MVEEIVRSLLAPGREVSTVSIQNAAHHENDPEVLALLEEFLGESNAAGTA